MELNERKRKKQNDGNQNKAFVLEEEDQIHITEDNASNVANGTSNKTDQHDKSLFEEKMKPFQDYLSQHREQIRMILYLVLAAGSIALVIAACVINFHRAIGLLVIASLTVFFLVWDWIMEHYEDRIWEATYPVRQFLSRNWFWMRWVTYGLLLLATVLWLALDTAQQGTRQIVSFFGLLLLVFLMLLFSKHPFRCPIQTILWGIVLQFVFALLSFRSTIGIEAMQWLGQEVETFLSFTDVGSQMVFGVKYTDHPFIFKVMPIVIFLSSVISILYYIGFMPWLISKLGFIMQVTMGTAPVESMSAAGNIFLGQTDSALLIRPYVSRLTKSEIHAVMTGGLAGLSGAILGAYISFGIEATHLLTASLMSAPSSLAIAKAFWPETETSATSSHGFKLEKAESINIFEAASEGASSAVGLVATIVANLIAIMALLAFCDAFLSWFGGMFDCPQLSFSLIFSYIFMPLSFMMGVSWEDSFIVAELIGMKTFFNEFVAYQKLSKLIKNRKAGGPEYVDHVKQYISAHSETIATYALCGFSNFASMGMAIGVLSSMAPDRRVDIARCGLRALIAGSVSCFMTACIAGTMYISEFNCPDYLSQQFNNLSVTNSSQLVACCTQLYMSVTVNEPWNITVGEGFTNRSLQGCCTLTPSHIFNCTQFFNTL